MAVVFPRIVRLRAIQNPSHRAPSTVRLQLRSAIVVVGAFIERPVSIIQAGLLVSVQGRGTSNLQGATFSYAWTFSDDASIATATGATTGVSWSSPGLKTITLTVTETSSGETATVTRQVQVVTLNQPLIWPPIPSGVIRGTRVLAATSTDTPTVKTYRYSNIGYISGTSTYWDERITSAPVFVGGKGQGQAGTMRLANGDGALDILRTVRWEGRRFYFWVGDARDDVDIGTFSRIGSLTVSRVIFGEDEVTVYLEDEDTLLDAATVTGQYPSGSDVEGQPVLRCVGSVNNVEPKLLDNALQVYSYNANRDGSTRSTLLTNFATIGGVALVNDGDDPDRATLESATIPAGHYRTCHAESLLRLGGPGPDRPLTISVYDTDDSHPAQLIADLAAEISFTVVADDLAAMKAAFTYTAGLILNDLTYREAINKLADSAGIAISFDELGALRMRRLQLPTIASAAYRIDLDGGTHLPPGPPKMILADSYKWLDSRAPTQFYELVYDRRWRRLEGNDLAVAAPGGTKGYYSVEADIETLSLPSIGTEYKSEARRRIDTVLILRADAQTELQRISELANRTLRLQVTINYNQDQTLLAGIPRYGDVVAIYWSRFNMSSGVAFIVEAVKVSLDTGEVAIELGYGR